jgi:hypothetical protein
MNCARVVLTSTRLGIRWQLMHLQRRMIACLVAASLVGSAGGCTATLYSVWPSQQVSDEVTVAQQITIHSVPDGAEVSTDDGRVLGPAPHRYELPYTAKRRWKRRSRTPILIGGLIAVAGLIGSAVYVGSREPDSAFGSGGYKGYALLALPIWEIMSAVPLYMRYQKSNQRELAPRGSGSLRAPIEGAFVEPIPARARLQLRWDGWAPVPAEISTPGPSAIWVRRPIQGTFDEAVIYWARTSGREPDADGLFRIAEAYRRLADRSRRREDAEAAIRYYERYLDGADVPDDKREQARNHVEALRAGAGR